jgi:c-di-GMP-binding flagellar brake protein YcgR
MQERRKHKRHTLRKGINIVHGDNMGELCNLSMGGMLCQCSINQMFSPDNSGVSICSAKDRLFLNSIKFKRIAEWHDESGDQATLIRRCGVEFDDLTDIQEAELHKLINRYAEN